MAYEEAPYKITYQSDTFEVRFYEERVVIQTSSKGSSSGFQKLFKYISGNNQNATKIEMTTPVTMLPDQGQMVMQFYLPSRFDLASAPLPADDSVEIERKPDSSDPFSALVFKVVTDQHVGRLVRLHPC